MRSDRPHVAYLLDVCSIEKDENFVVTSLDSFAHNQRAIRCDKSRFVRPYSICECTKPVKQYNAPFRKKSVNEIIKIVLKSEDFCT